MPNGARRPSAETGLGEFAGGAEPEMDALVSDSAPERCELMLPVPWALARTPGSGFRDACTSTVRPMVARAQTPPDRR